MQLFMQQFNSSRSTTTTKKNVLWWYKCDKNDFFPVDEWYNIDSQSEFTLPYKALAFKAE